MPRAKERNVGCNSLNYFVVVVNISRFLPKRHLVIHSRIIFYVEISFIQRLYVKRSR